MLRAHEMIAMHASQLASARDLDNKPLFPVGDPYHRARTAPPTGTVEMCRNLRVVRMAGLAELAESQKT